MPLEITGNELTADGKFRVTRIKDDNWPSIVIIIDAKDKVNINYVDNDPTNISMKLTKGEGG